jgi:SWI/SNF-related matrix-associated actin-dependent regulator 1 of chromatin subfamily A
MQQAEDRAHRIGQKSCVNCHYLVAENTLDEILYRKLESKLSTVGQMIDGQRHKLSAEVI